MIKVLKLVPAGSYTGLIWFISSKTLPVSLGHMDKLAHLAEYSVLGLLLAFGLGAKIKTNPRNVRYAMMLGLCIGVIDETIQYFTPGRSCDFLDLLVDVFAIFLGICIFSSFVYILSFVNKDLFTQKQ